MGKRLILFLLTNVLVLATIGLVTTLFGLPQMMEGTWLGLLALCFVWGMGGSFISLALSRIMAKAFMGVKLVDRSSGGDLLAQVEALSKKAGIPMPEVGIYDSPEINAFATGPTRNRSLVAVSTGLLNSMDRREVQGVLAHEIAHIANGDMVTMTLIQGVVNAFAMFLSRIIAFAVARAVNSDVAWLVRVALTFVLDIVFSILGSIAVNAFSRHREYAADALGAQLAGKDSVIACLEKLQARFEPLDKTAPAMASMKISQKSGFLALFSTHPPLESRIAALKNRS